MRTGGGDGVSRASYEDALAKCPYYMEQDACSVKCEGLTRLGSLTVRFRTKRQKGMWTSRYCNSVKGCEACPVWQMKTGRQE